MTQSISYFDKEEDMIYTIIVTLNSSEKLHADMKPSFIFIVDDFTSENRDINYAMLRAIEGEYKHYEWYMPSNSGDSVHCLFHDNGELKWKMKVSIYNTNNSFHLDLNFDKFIKGYTFYDNEIMVNRTKKETIAIQSPFPTYDSFVEDCKRVYGVDLRELE